MISKRRDIRKYKRDENWKGRNTNNKFQQKKKIKDLRDMKSFRYRFKGDGDLEDKNNYSIESIIEQDWQYFKEEWYYSINKYQAIVKYDTDKEKYSITFFGENKPRHYTKKEM